MTHSLEGKPGGITMNSQFLSEKKIYTTSEWSTHLSSAACSYYYIALVDCLFNVKLERERERVGEWERRRSPAASGEPPSAWLQLDINWKGRISSVLIEQAAMAKQQRSLAASAPFSHRNRRTARLLPSPSLTQPWCKGGGTLRRWLALLCV